MAPLVVVQRAQMIVGSWEGQRTTEIAAEFGCHPQTVREGLHRFNELGAKRPVSAPPTGC